MAELAGFGAFDCFVIGGGGHARVLLDILGLVHPRWRIGILDRDSARSGTTMMGALVLGSDELLEVIARESSGARFVVGLGGVGDNNPRRLLFEHALALGLEPLTLRHPTAVLSRHASVGAGAQLLAACVVNPGAVLGRNVIVNSAAVVEHDCVIGDHAHVATGANLASAVKVGEAAHVGAGAVVLQGISVGSCAVVGAGAVVVKDVPAGAVVVGVPAKPMRREAGDRQ